MGGDWPIRLPLMPPEALDDNPYRKGRDGRAPAAITSGHGTPV